MVAQHPSVYKQNSDCAIHPICSRSRQNLHRSSSYSQLASHSLLATQRIFCIFNSKAREWGLLGCCAENCELSMCLYLFYPWHTSTMSSILNPQSRKLFHFPRKLELLYHSQDEWWRCILVELETNLREVWSFAITYKEDLCDSDPILCLHTPLNIVS